MLVPVLLALVDLAVIMYGVQLNNTACRNAAQAVASGDPAEAQYRAETVLNQVNNRTTGELVSHFALDGPVESKIEAAPIPYRDPMTGRTVNPGGLITGTATVITTVEIRPFIVYRIYGGRLPLKFSCRQNVPIRYVVPMSESRMRDIRVDGHDYGVFTTKLTIAEKQTGMNSKC